jgi:nucleoid-associated protein YgaU
MEQLQKATLIATYHSGEMEIFEVQFNPTEFSLDKGAQIAEIAIPGLDSPLLQFVRGQNEKMTLDLFFDTTEKGMGPGATSVTTLTDRIYELVKIEPAGHAPPVCTFVWNSKFPGADISARAGNQKRTDFQCVIESIKQKFTLFNPEGIPLRATLTLTLREYKTLDQQLHQLNLSSPDRTHSHVVQQGETLSRIAARYYRKPGEWRHVADANELEDPRRLIVGAFLTIPPIQ